MIDQISPAPAFGLPPGYTTRSVTMADVPAAVDLLNAHSMVLAGRPWTTEAELASEWQSPATSMTEKILAVFTPGGDMTGLAQIWHGAPWVRVFVFVAVHPDHWGRGIGAALATWAEARGRSLASAAPRDARVVLRQFIPTDDERGVQLLLAQGYELVRYNLQLVIDFDGRPEPPVLPDGITIRPVRWDEEAPALLRAVREEFRDHWGHIEQPFEEDYREWKHYMDTNPTADSSLFFAAFDGDQIAGNSLVQRDWAEDPQSGWIYALGVRRSWRRRGLALALLRHSFVALHERGKRRATLGVDAESLTGATRLYEKAGMWVLRRYAFFEKEVRPGRDLATHELTAEGQP